MQNKVYSQSLKKIKKYDSFDCSMEKLIKMQKIIKKQENLTKPKQKPMQSMIEARKQLVNHKISKNTIEKQVDNVIKSLVDSKKLQIDSQRITKKHSYKHYRIQTEPIQKELINEKKSIKASKKQRDASLDKKNPPQNPQSFLPQIITSKITKKFQMPYSRKLKTQQDLIQRLYQDPKQKLIEFINVQNVIKHYRAGMTSLVKGTSSSKYQNPYKKVYD